MSLLSTKSSPVRSFVLLAAFVGSALLLSGCATLFGGGGTEEVTIESNPEGANVYLRGELKGKTPLTTTVERDKTHLLRFKKDGYGTESVTLRQEYRVLWFIEGIFIVPLAVDAYTGAIYRLKPNPARVNLEEK
jgi:hypothetical protein